jgi:choline dehydrogenase-like flavoprotein
MSAMMLLSRPDDLVLLGAVLDRIVPADQDPSASGFGADTYVMRRLDAPGENRSQAIAAGLAALNSLSKERFAMPFAGLGDADKDALLAGDAGDDWFVALTALVAEGVYADPANGGNRDAGSWKMVGYQHGLPEGPSGPPKRPVPAARRLPTNAEHNEYDVIVVGAGASGGVAACVLAESGKRVLLIERGYEHTYANSGQRDHLRNHRNAQYGHNTGPALDGNPRVFVDADGKASEVKPNEGGYNNIAAGVGSGTVVYGGMAWRFLPDDFRMASRYGVPEGSSLVDWPIGYDDLAPFYDRAEWEIGVAGEGAGNVHQGPRQRGYPMPPVPGREAQHVLSAGAERLGFSTFPPPILINTVPRDGRAACIECGTCVGFPCPSDAKNGTQNTVIPRALATGRCDLITGATVEYVEQDERGRVIGVRYVQADASDAPVRRSIRSRAVMLCCGAIETARLLLLSKSRAHPEGLGNAHDLVGRNLQGHYYPTTFGLFEEGLHSSRGPGVTIATSAFNHGNAGVIGGAMLADDFVMPPIIFWDQALPPDLPRWGQAAKSFMRDNYRRMTQVKGPVQEIPDPNCRVTLADLTDHWGLPVARLSGTTHMETVRTASFILGKAEEWLRASGAKSIWSKPPRQRLSAGQHQAGTCRMGSDPTQSVTDSFGRVWGHENLFISDGSLHPTNGGFNPVLTIMALAFRNAEHVAGSI